MKKNQTLISALQLKIQTPNFFKELMDKKITAIAYDYIQDDNCDCIIPSFGRYEYNKEGSGVIIKVL